MNIKKSHKANLEKDKTLHPAVIYCLSNLIGFTIVFAALLITSEWTKMEAKKYGGFGNIVNVGEKKVTQVTMHLQTLPPPPSLPPPPPPPPLSPSSNLATNEASYVVAGNQTVASIAISDAESEQQATVVQLPAIPATSFTRPILKEEDMIFDIVDKNPEFPGGSAAMYNFISNAIRYHQEALDLKLHGRVVCQFTVNRDGSITDIVILHGVDAILDNEVKRVIASMPKWKPAEQRGKAVRVKFTLPVVFNL